jgi:integrase
MTLEAMEYLQDQLLDGAEGRYACRSPNTANSMMGAVMAFVRYCYDHEWIGRVPPVKKIDVDEVMRGRPIKGEEFDRMLVAVPKVVGEGPAESWRFTLDVLWESGFRIADVMQFAWDDDEKKIHPVWPSRSGQHPTIVIPSKQKNRKVEEIPLLPGLQRVLDTVPAARRSGFVVDPLPIEYEMKCQRKWFMPTPEDLQILIADHSNLAIAKACGVSDVTVRNWLSRLVLRRKGKVLHFGEEVPQEVIQAMRKRAVRRRHQRPPGRLTDKRVSEIIAAIGQRARVVVRQPDEETGQRIKYASAHDLRRSLAERLINAGVSAETLMVVMRHRDFATTRKFYGATRAAQAAAAEIHSKLAAESGLDALVGR